MDKPGFWQVVLSVLAALFGVQTETNRQRDFSAGNPLVYIVVFIILLSLFVLLVSGVVTLVLKYAGMAQ